MSDHQDDALDMEPGTEATVIWNPVGDVIVHADGTLELDTDGPAELTRAQAIEIAWALLRAHGIGATRAGAIEITKALLGAHGIEVIEEWGFDTGLHDGFVRYDSKEDAEDQARGRPHLQRRLAYRLVTDPIPAEDS